MIIDKQFNDTNYCCCWFREEKEDDKINQTNISKRSQNQSNKSHTA